ncbi:DEKNAAC103951 [Brettanomyces naardenensis]|uniref:DEKNAAC103951 n=1 Tax=Brettanomyces naardenensis TaxID=13370 RepID=A0A448YPM0_BRENA|nr:DEKNAAC103951 [Brettanomyces naardenensis]
MSDSIVDSAKAKLVDVQDVDVKSQESQSKWAKIWFHQGDHLDIERKYADVTFDLIEKNGGSVAELTPEKEKKLKRKLWLIIVPLVFLVNATLFIDKDAITYSPLLGVLKDMNMSKQDYNNVLTFFYVGYLLGQAPSHYIFQRIPLSKYISGTIAIWAILSFCTLGSKSYAGLSVLRFFLGFVESGITPAVEHTMSMFFTLDEQAIVNPIFWISCVGIDVPTGFISYGLQFTTKWRPWKWYWLIIGIISSLASILSFFFYPDNPATTRLFTIEERIHIIQRVKKATKSSIEQKTFKKYQFIEALRDPITWLFVLFCFMNMLENSTMYQASIIYTALGFSNLTTTLLMVVQNGFGTLCAILGSVALYVFKSQSAYVAAIWSIPAFLGAIIAISVDYSNKAGMLAGIFLTRANGTVYIIAFCLCQSTAAGYTKRLTRTLLFMVAYGVSNTIAPQLWKPQYSPRYRVSWLIQIVFSWFLAPLVLLVVRYILSARNKQRLQDIRDSPESEIDYGYIETIDDDGSAVRHKVDVSMLDLTDLENKRFIYPL